MKSKNVQWNVKRAEKVTSQNSFKRSVLSRYSPNILLESNLTFELLGFWLFSRSTTSSQASRFQLYTDYIPFPPQKCYNPSSRMYKCRTTASSTQGKKREVQSLPWRTSRSQYLSGERRGAGVGRILWPPRGGLWRYTSWWLGGWRLEALRSLMVSKITCDVIPTRKADRFGQIQTSAHH